MYKNIIREKKIYCGKKYMEVDIYNFSLQNARASRGRSKKEKVSLPSQKNQNEKNAKKISWTLTQILRKKKADN